MTLDADLVFMLKLNGGRGTSLLVSSKALQWARFDKTEGLLIAPSLQCQALVVAGGPGCFDIIGAFHHVRRLSKGACQKGGSLVDWA